MLARLQARRDERGSVIMLLPVGVLIVIILAAITVDFSNLYLAKREMHSAASGAANDAAAAGIDGEKVRQGAPIEEAVDVAAAHSAASASLAASGIDDSMSLTFVSDGPRIGVRVTLTRQVSYIFVPAVPGAPGSSSVTSSASAFLEEG